MQPARATVRTLIASLAALLWLAVAPAGAQNRPPLPDRLTPEVMEVVYPGAERLGPVEGKTQSIAVYSGEAVVGFIFSTLEVVRAPGYAAYPFDVVAGVTVDGVITGSVVLDHREPHINNDAHREALLDQYLASQAGYVVDGGQPGRRPDFVEGATISARAMRAAIMDSARFVLQDRLGREPVTEPTLDRETFWPMSFDEMAASGAIARLRLTGAEVAALAAAQGIPQSALPRPIGNPEQVYSDVVVGLGSVMAVARNLLVPQSAARQLAERPAGTESIIVGSNGRYGVMGTSYNQAETGYRFDRFRIVQGDRVITFVRDQFITASAAGARLQSAGAFFVSTSAFDPLKPFTLEFLINTTGADGAVRPIVVPVTYTLPEAHILLPPPAPVPAYVEAWSEARTDVIILVSALLVLCLIFAFQGFLARHRKAFNVVRTSFLLFTLVWLGWTAGGQLSTVHLINYAMAPLHNFDVGYYLAEPLIVIIAAFTLASLVVLGRGVFCGWLCPFGALQELLAKISRALRLPQWNPPAAWQKRLWLGKYVAAVAVVAATFASPDLAAAAEEVEPFKTAITSFFTRAWPFELYAVALLLVGLFTERAYCRFLCPLGGTLAALDRMHLVDVLKRRPECGSPCKLCEHSCPVKAIEPSGKIKMAECFQCLDCQVEYHDDHRCPPLAKARKAKERRAVPSKGTAIRVPPLVPGVARAGSG
jgi:transcriptional regulator of nitric oxide reductase